MNDILSIFNEEMQKLGIQYYFMNNTSESVTYPYFTGEFSENGYQFSNDMSEGTILLEGWTRGSYIELIDLVEKIKNHFNNLQIVTDDLCVCFYYNSHDYIRQDDINLKKAMIYINLTYTKGH